MFLCNELKRNTMISTIPKWAGELLESVVGQRAEVIHATYLSPYLKKYASGVILLI